jgi:hypothetical protein
MTFLREIEVRARARQRADAEGFSIAEALTRTVRRRLPRYDILLSRRFATSRSYTYRTARRLKSVTPRWFSS